MKDKITQTPISLQQGLRSLWNDRDGSEAIEMVYNMVALVFLVMSAMLIIGYALQTNQVYYAEQRLD